MSQGDLGRARAPPGYYCGLLQDDKGKGMSEKNTKMAEGGNEDSKGRGKKIKGKTSSKVSSKKSVNLDARLKEFEDEDQVLERKEGELEQKIEELETRDSRSRALHNMAMHGKVEFLEDWEAPETLEKDSVWSKTEEDHLKELKAVKDREVRLSRLQELIMIKDEIRTRRIELMKREKALEMEEKRKQIEAQEEWLKMAEEEHQMKLKWEMQQDWVAAFQEKNRLEGWVAKAAEQVSRGDVASMHSANRGLNVERRHASGLGKNSRGIQQSELERQAEQLRKKELLHGAPESGVQHLQRMGMLPDYGFQSEVSVGKLPSQHKSAVPGITKVTPNADMWDHLSQKDDAGKTELVDVGDGATAGASRMVVKTKEKVKSGKFARSHVDLVREEAWPHVAVLRQYGKRGTFDQMDYETFVAGEVRIILAMMKKSPDRATGRLGVLCRIAHWLCKCRDWGAVRNVFEAIIESVELGDEEWTSRFDWMESMIPPAVSVLERMKKDVREGKDQRDYAGKDRENKEGKKVGDVFWCKDYQKGQCQEKSPHMAQLKPDDKPVPVVHICAVCWQKEKKRREHQEGDENCPNSKKA